MARRVVPKLDHRRPTLGGAACIVSAAFVWASCSGGESNADGATAGGTGGSSTSAASATASGSGGTTGSSANAASGVTATASGGIDLPDASGDGGFEDCEADVSMAQGVGLDMYIVFDRSISMQDGDCDGDCTGVPDGAVEGDCPIDLAAAPATSSKWCLATNALAQFFTTPTQLDVRVAFQFMSPDGTNDDTCGAVPENPHGTAAVDFVQLPVDALQPLVTTLGDETPEFGGTRIESALNGIAMYTSANADPMRKTIGVLITDGVPQFGCSEDDDELAQIAADHLMATEIPTFFIGMTGASYARLETMAETAGGPEHGPDYCDAGDDTCHYWTVGDGDPAAFGEVLAAIQDSVIIPCEYAIPEPMGGQKVNPELVAVTYDDASGAEPAGISKVADEASCDPTLGGWYFDNPMEPTAVRLCPVNCTTVGSAPSGAAVQIRYGCRQGID